MEFENFPIVSEGDGETKSDLLYKTRILLCISLPLITNDCHFDKISTPLNRYIWMERIIKGIKIERCKNN